MIPCKFSFIVVFLISKHNLLRDLQYPYDGVSIPYQYDSSAGEPACVLHFGFPTQQKVLFLSARLADFIFRSIAATPPVESQVFRIVNNQYLRLHATVHICRSGIEGL